MLFKKPPDFVHYAFDRKIALKYVESCSQKEIIFSLAIGCFYGEIMVDKDI